MGSRETLPVGSFLQNVSSLFRVQKQKPYYVSLRSAAMNRPAVSRLSAVELSHHTRLFSSMLPTFKIQLLSDEIP
jgi:hypothetical protein